MRVNRMYNSKALYANLVSGCSRTAAAARRAFGALCAQPLASRINFQVLVLAAAGCSITASRRYHQQHQHLRLPFLQHGALQLQ
jgi:hypothetical protein